MLDPFVRAFTAQAAGHVTAIAEGDRVTLTSGDYAERLTLAVDGPGVRCTRHAEGASASLTIRSLRDVPVVLFWCAKVGVLT